MADLRCNNSQATLQKRLHNTFDKKNIASSISYRYKSFDILFQLGCNSSEDIPHQLKDGVSI